MKMNNLTLSFNTKEKTPEKRKIIFSRGKD